MRPTPQLCTNVLRDAKSTYGVSDRGISQWQAIAATNGWHWARRHQRSGLGTISIRGQPLMKGFRVPHCDTAAGSFVGTKAKTAELPDKAACSPVPLGL
jgi:hypothetical protein